MNWCVIRYRFIALSRQTRVDVFFQVAYIYVSLWCHFRIIHSKESDNECVCFNYVSQTLQGATDNILLFIPLLAKRRCIQPSDVFTNQNSVKAVKTQFLSFVQKVHLHASTSERLLAE